MVDQIEHGITSPRYIDNPLYKVTNAKYDEFPGELTRPGIYQMEAIGKELRKEYIDQNKFLPNEFKPENFYLKTYRDQPSSLSSYATMLGAYPNSVAWIQYQSMGRGSAEAPFTKEEEADVRKALSLSDNPSRLSTRDVTIWAETDGRTFFNDPLNNCPQMHKEMNHNLDIANSKYTDNKRFEGMFEAMEKTLGIADETLTFKNAHLYLDDYATAEANNKPHPEFKEQIVADSYISNYYRRFYYEGKFGNDLNLARVSSNHFFSYLLTSMYGKYKVAKGEISNQHYEHLKYAQFVGNENSLIGLDKLLNDNPVDPILPPRFGSKYRFELFEDAGKYFVKTTMDGEPAKIKGATDGVMPYENFMKYIYSLLYFGNVDKYCSGQESLTGKDKPQEANYEKYIWEQHSELRGEQKTASTQTKNTGFTEQKFVEIEQRSEPKVVEVVEPIVVSRPPPRPQGQIIYNYQGEASANRREYISPPPPRQQYISAPPPPRQQYTPAPPPPIYQNSYHTTQSTQRSEYTQEPSFIDIVEKCKALEVQAKPAPAKAVQYNMYETLEHKVDIPYLHPVDIPQVIHDTKYVVVPKAVPKAVIHEKLITEKPTEIHHIKIDMEEAAPIAAPVQFAEVVPEKAGWPWWWWIPLLLL